jgi:hypothetical protein
MIKQKKSSEEGGELGSLEDVQVILLEKAPKSTAENKSSIYPFIFSISETM